MPIDAAMQPLFRDVTDHVRRVQEEIDSLREVLAFAFEASLMTGQAQQTAITRRLAAWAAILAVPTAIAGIYGMNFEHMPELKWRYGYFLVIGVIATICDDAVPAPPTLRLAVSLSQTVAAASDANFGTKGTLATIHLILVPLLNPKFATAFATRCVRTSGSRH